MHDNRIGQSLTYLATGCAAAGDSAAHTHRVGADAGRAHGRGTHPLQHPQVHGRSLTHDHGKAVFRDDHPLGQPRTGLAAFHGILQSHTAHGFIAFAPVRSIQIKIILLKLKDSSMDSSAAGSDGLLASSIRARH